MKANIIKRMLCGALALSLVLAPSMSTLATSGAGTVSGNAVVAEVQETATAATVAYTTTSNAAGIASQVGGVYILRRGIGVAITTPASTIAANYGLAAGERVFVKAMDMDIRKSNLAYQCMTNTAAAYGATIVGTINLELGKMSGGRYSLLEAGAEVPVTFSVPRAAQGQRIGVIRVQEGGVVTVFEDMDTNPATVSFNITGGAAAYAIIAY
ncbi:MAG: hypothetical protein PUI46_11260 [Lachnospiraceae bacterium]|nr:hypothetical protein [Lachnospiraceae bacterium]MDY5700029.1 hypothetical protein [Lachnospiraceae bacterium]